MTCLSPVSSTPMAAAEPITCSTLQRSYHHQQGPSDEPLQAIPTRAVRPSRVIPLLHHTEAAHPAPR